MMKLTRQQLLDGAMSLAMEVAGNENHPPTVIAPDDGQGGWGASWGEPPHHWTHFTDTEVVIRSMVLVALGGG